MTGDHGEALGDHGEETHGVFAYESTLRVPLYRRCEIGGGPNARNPDAPSADGPNVGSVRLQPDLTGRGEVSSIAARHVDILPTVLDAVGQPVPADVPGRTLLPATERRSAAPRPSSFEAMSAMLNRGWAPLSGILTGRDKFIDLPVAERYDPAADAAEVTNLAGQSPERDRTLVAALHGFGAALPGQRRTENAEVLRACARSATSAAARRPGRSILEADDPKRLIALDQSIHRGVALYLERRFPDAMRVYQDVVKQRPDMAIAYQHLAFVAWESGDVSAAVGVLQQALRAGVTHAALTTQLGTYLAESGNPSKRSGCSNRLRDRRTPMSTR